MVRILIGGDVCPMGEIENAFREGKADEIFHDLLREITCADLSIVNLECPLVSRETPIIKPAPVLAADIASIQGFKVAKWSILNLANNHSFDHGADGLRETVRTIEQAGLSVVGAGENIKEAQKPVVKQINGERIVIYSMADQEFSIADDKTPGANTLDLINFVSAIQQHKQGGIFLVLIHGGPEYYPYPSPEMVRRCRFMVDMGADAVICCHTHCPLPWEIYAGRPIAYSLGNLIFEASIRERDTWYEGYMVRLTLGNGKVDFEPIPYFQSRASSGAMKMDQDAQTRFLHEMEQKSAQLKDDLFLENEWLKYCRLNKQAYMEWLFGYNRFMRKLGGPVFKALHSKREVLQALLLVQCETHREVLTTLFRDERRTK